MHLPLPGSTFWVPEPSPERTSLAIDVFYVEGENGGIVEDSTIRSFFEDTLESFLKGKDCPIEQISAHRKKKEKPKTFSTTDKFGATIPPQVDVYRDISLGRTIVEVRQLTVSDYSTLYPNTLLIQDLVSYLLALLQSKELPLMFSILNLWTKQSFPPQVPFWTFVRNSAKHSSKESTTTKSSLSA